MSYSKYFPVNLPLLCLLLIFLLCVSILYLRIVDTPSLHTLMYVSVRYSAGWYCLYLKDCRDSVYFMPHTFEYSAVFRLLVYTGICFQHSQYSLSGFHTTGSISVFPTVRGTAGIQCYSESILLEHAAVFPGSILWITSEYSQYLAFSSMVVVVLLTYSQYSQYFSRQYYYRNTLSIMVS